VCVCAADIKTDRIASISCTIEKQSREIHLKIEAGLRLLAHKYSREVACLERLLLYIGG
jgi:hypothetical protein